MAGSSLIAFDGEQRGAAMSGELGPLANALSEELVPWLDRELPIPAFKARLTRIGGWCPNEGAMLVFNPFSPHEHRCPVCGSVQQGREHDEYWAMGAQLWVVERAVQSAALYALAGNPVHKAFAIRIVSELTDRYQQWPNRDNVLGPSHPFFSTYLESIWLLNVCHAIALLECDNTLMSQNASASADRLSVHDSLDNADRIALSVARDRLIEPSAALIASCNEHRSNRQVWNEVAILSAMRMLDQSQSIARRLEEQGGLFDLLRHGLLDDGTWYEGENYHLFAHRGLWYGVELLGALHRQLPDDLDARFVRGFVTPFLGLLPDLTFPSRRDSKYAVSIRQWRFAEWCELGVARAARSLGHLDAQRALEGIRWRLYNDAVPRRDTGRARSTADAERAERATLLTRADLSWRALLAMPLEVPRRNEWHPSSVCLPEQGLAVIRRNEGATYVALEGGHSGGGHGHPDRLALTLQHGESRWLDDPGTGSYVATSLHWYRSTLAHAAPLVNGASQPPSRAQLLAFGERKSPLQLEPSELSSLPFAPPHFGWISKQAQIGTHTVAVRSVVVADSYLVDVLEWRPVDSANASADGDVVDLPIARAAHTSLVNWQPIALAGAGNTEDGFDFLLNTEIVDLPGRTFRATLHAHAPHDLPALHIAHAWYASSAPMQLWRAMAPGPPECADQPLHVIRANASKGRTIGVMSWSSIPPSVLIDVEQSVVQVNVANQTSHTHIMRERQWNIATTRIIDGTTSTDTFEVPLDAPLPSHQQNHDSPMDIDANETEARYPSTILNVPRVGLSVSDNSHPAFTNATHITLGRNNYRQTETSWDESDHPSADIRLAATSDTLIIDIAAHTGDPVVPEANARNPLDNERADVNADGVQLYIGNARTTRSPSWTDSWLIVPAVEVAPNARITALTPSSREIFATWTSISDGWAVRIHVPLRADEQDGQQTLLFNLVVNERTPDRERRRGQLVLSGAGGFAYLRGDREDPMHAVILELERSAPTPVA